MEEVVRTHQAINDISIYFVPYILVLANRYRANELKSICQKFCVENYDAVKKSGGLEYLRQRGESSKVHISNADNNNNNPLGITFKIWNDQEN
ncbi:hypothetical protein ACSQ67_020399 [Phaseolus vulgaris]